jgi:putative DNA primase/helicase
MTIKKGPLVNFALATPPFEWAAPRLAANGYKPVPVEWARKAPIPRRWTNFEFASHDAARYRDAGTGILGGEVVGIDIDVRDARLSAELTKLARTTLGPAPTRIGAAPKILLLYRTRGAPFRKSSTSLYVLPQDQVGDKPHRVEVLAKGQQFVAYNIHVETKKPYRWNGEGDPLTVPMSKLVGVTQRQVDAFVLRADRILARAGKLAGRLLKAEVDDREHAPNPELRAYDPKVLREALTKIPNDDLDYDSWIRIGYAIKGALGESGAADWVRWSAQSVKNDPKTTRKAWGGFRPRSIGAGTIYFHAARQGWRPRRRSKGTQKIRLLCASDVQMEAIRWLWPGWVAAGKLHILAGVPGTGKTTIALALAAALTRGGAWPDGQSAEGTGNVVIWSGEDDAADTLVPRLTAMNADLSRVHLVRDVKQTSGTRPFDPSTDMVALMAKADELGDVRLLIVDPVVTAVSSDSHRNAEVRRDLAPLVDFGHKIGAAVLGISHFSKGTSGRDPLDRVTGSLAFGALARLVLGTAKRIYADGSDNRVLVRIKSNLGLDGGGIEYTLQTAAVDEGIVASKVVWGNAVEGDAREILQEAEGVGESAGSEALDEAKTFLLDKLQDGSKPSADLKAAAAEAGISAATLRRAQTALGIKPRKGGMQAGWFCELPKVLNDPEDALE